MDAIRHSALFRSLAASHKGVDVWELPDPDEDRRSYFSIVSDIDSGYRVLAYLRLNDGQLEKRIYDDAVEDLWVAAD